MRKIFVIVIILILQFNSVHSQNIIANGSFEDTVTCQQWLNLSNGLLICIPWFMAMGTPDYFSNSIFLNFCGASTLYPNSILGYQLPRTGSGMAGFELKNMNTEMISSSIQPMIQSHLYFLSYYISLCNNCKYVTDDIGAYLSIDSLNPDSILTLNLSPQVSNPQGNYINDTAGWTLISGYYQAIGGEQYLYIGNFKNAANTTFDTIAGASYWGSYYFLDDVSLIDCTATSIVENTALQFQSLNNPVNGTLQFITATKVNRCFIYDMIGNKISTYNLNQNTNTYTVSVTDLKQGMYLLVIEDIEKRRGMRKFIKQ
ncbi:MAG TPA: T9SS type A sorting domain-containing protein [Bacteroidia bacterium]|nr:T9SS type A sorting domain-containing protein [Bacteroidia bacterium]